MGKLIALFFHSIASLVMAECACASLIFTSFTEAFRQKMKRKVFPIGTLTILKEMVDNEERKKGRYIFGGFIVR